MREAAVCCRELRLNNQPISLKKLGVVIGPINQKNKWFPGTYGMKGDNKKTRVPELSGR